MHRKNANDLELREARTSESSNQGKAGLMQLLSTKRSPKGSPMNSATTGMSAGMTGMTGGGISVQTFKKLNREFIKEMQVRYPKYAISKPLTTMH